MRVNSPHSDCSRSKLVTVFGGLEASFASTPREALRLARVADADDRSYTPPPPLQSSDPTMLPIVDSMGGRDGVRVDDLRMHA
jgi:hypothetical protein